MSATLRITLIASALVVLLFVVRKIRKAQFRTGDSLFWLLLSICLVFTAIFPGVTYLFSELLGIQSPSNFVFLVIIALLLIREFSNQVRLAQLSDTVTSLAQHIALNETKEQGKGIADSDELGEK